MKGSLFALILCASTLSAQDQAGQKPVTLGDITATAERTPAPVSSSTASVTKLSAEDLAKVPHATIADLLRLTPGFTQVDGDGSGSDPRLMVRGFYGGGEAEYVVVMINGKPVNQLNTGVVAWDVLPPLASIESIEILKGSSSALYGDAALGATINIITRKGNAASDPTFSASTGSFGIERVGISESGEMLGRVMDLFGGIDRLKGFRAHSRKDTYNASLSSPIWTNRADYVRLTVRGNWRTFDEPGPMLDTELAAAPKGSDLLFRFDRTKDHSYKALLDGARAIGKIGKVSGGVSGEFRDILATRTLALAPGYGDTKDHHLSTTRQGGNIEYTISTGTFPTKSELLIGAELNRGGLDSKYYQLMTGTRDDYAASHGTRGSVDAIGHGTRNAGAAFTQLTLIPTTAVRFSAGVRYDWLHDTFKASAPSDPSDLTSKLSSVSPKVGINFRYSARPLNTGHLYVTASRSFKAPTLDQLFDQRSIPVPFPPYSVHTSNSALKPQHGNSIEAGIYQDVHAGSGVQVSTTLTAYTIAMTDELDFDVTTLKYVNIGKSRHQGIEAGAKATVSKNVSGFANFTYQAATTRGGDNDGKYLKAIPRQSLNAGINVSPIQALALSGIVNSVSDIWLDDANTVSLPSYATVDFQSTYHFSQSSVFANVRNLFGKKYNSGGYLDPAGSGQKYFNPAAGRSFEIGVRAGW